MFLFLLFVFNNNIYFYFLFFGPLGCSLERKDAGPKSLTELKSCCYTLRPGDML